MKLRHYVMFISLLALASCDDGINLFPSEKKIRNSIRHTWSSVPMTDVDYKGAGQEWRFDDSGNLHITFKRYNDATHTIYTELDSGQYSISTDWKSAFVRISGLVSDEAVIHEKLNSKWEIIQVDDVLYIAAKPDGSGLMQKEFTKAD